MPNGDLTDQWFLEVNGKKFGPYTMAQIHALVRHQEIVGEDKVTGSHLNGRWISVQEFVSKTGSSRTEVQAAASPVEQTVPVESTPATVPPRPDERTMTSLIAPSMRQVEPRKSGSDAVLNLFEILQAARERKPQTPNAVGHEVVEMPRPVRSSSGSPLLWFAVPAVVVASVVVWKMSTGPSPSAPVAQTEPSDVKIAKPAPAPAAKPAAPRTVAAVNPPARAKALTSLSSGFATGRQQLRAPVPVNNSIADREKEREKERELEREKERVAERELERDRETENSRNYSTNEPGRREKEREREREVERDQRNGDRSDWQAASNGSSNNGNGGNAVAADGLPVRGGIRADANAFRDSGSDMGGDPNADSDSGRAPAGQTP